MMMAAPFQSMTLGALRITYVPDGYGLFKPTGLFPTTRETDWQDYQHFLDEQGQLVGSLGAHVIQTPKQTLLVDTAFGPADFEGTIVTLDGGTFLQNLKKARIDPADIDTVFFTHLHLDHVGWTGQIVDGQPILTFPNARFLVRSTEWHRFDDPAESRAGIEVALHLLAPRIELIEDGAPILPEATVLATSGHTPGHASLLLTSGKERAIVLGDVFHSRIQFEHPEWTDGLDSDPERAKRTRHQMLQELAQPDTLGIGTHLADSVFGRLTSVQSKYQWSVEQPER